MMLKTITRDEAENLYKLMRECLGRILSETSEPDVRDFSEALLRLTDKAHAEGRMLELYYMVREILRDKVETDS